MPTEIFAFIIKFGKRQGHNELRACGSSKYFPCLYLLAYGELLVFF